MSNIRHRKPATADTQSATKNELDNVDVNDPPPSLSLVNCESWERNFDDDTSSSEPATSPLVVAKNNTSTTTSSPSSSTSSALLDKFLSTYCTFSSRTFTTDQGLKVLQWSLWALSYMTKSNNRCSNKHLSPSLRKLYLELSFTRYILRFYGFLQSLEGYRSGSWAGGDHWENPLIPKIAKYVLAGSMLFYYPLEHVAYVGWQVPQLVPRVNANKFSAISCWFWTVYIVGDFWMNCLKLQELKKKLGDLMGDMAILAGSKTKTREEQDDAITKKEDAVVSSMLISS